MWGGFPGSMYIWYMVSTCGLSVAEEGHGRSSSLAHQKLLSTIYPGLLSTTQKGSLPFYRLN